MRVPPLGCGEVITTLFLMHCFDSLYTDREFLHPAGGGEAAERIFGSGRQR